MKKGCFLLSAALLTINIFSFSSKSTYAQKAEKSCSIRTLPSKTFFYVPLDSIRTDNSVSELRKEFSDSFFCDAANQLLTYYLSQYQVPVTNAKDSILQNVKASTINGCSLLDKDTIRFDSASALIKEIAQRSKAEYVIIPYSCILQERKVVQKAWRDGRGGPSYGRPVKNIASVGIHLQIWDKNGKLLCEYTGDGKESKPMFYSFFKKRLKITSTINYSRKIYANPFVRALNEASRELVKN